MANNFRSILQDLESFLPAKDKHLIVESRANHVISSAINILKLINENFSPQEADDLNRRFLLAIKNHNPRKFEAGMKKLRESKNED